MTATQAAYAEGYWLGIERGEKDMHDALGNQHDQLAFYREMCQRDVHGANVRAWYLGCARGYREVVRTLRNGRWGT